MTDAIHPINKHWFHNIDLNSPKTFSIACIVAPLIFGLISVLLGADTNWDLTNYHLYNPFALLHGKLQIDLAPAGMQTYFNPILDLPYYWLAWHLPGPLVGFIMGLAHGLNFVLLAFISLKTLPNLPSEDRLRIPLIIAVFGCLTANFLSAIGNTMGDNMTSVFVLASLLIILSNWTSLSKHRSRLVFAVTLAGAFAGMAAGLKLTNTVYAVALCTSFYVSPGSLGKRFLNAILFGAGVVLGIAVTGGYWHYEMWRAFGNPLYPQYSAFFPNPLTFPIQVADTIWRPKTFAETVFWPFIFSMDSQRVGQLQIRQVIWPVVYVLFWFWLAVSMFGKRIKGSSINAVSPATYVISVVAIGYLVWMKFFSIQRYLVAIEVLTPLIIFVMLSQITAFRKARKIAIYTLAATTAVVLLGGLRTWGHAPWSEKIFRIDLPPLEKPVATTVIMVGGDSAFGWVAALFPPEVAFAQVQGNFPESMPAYANRVHEMATTRGGAVFALFEGHRNWRADQIARIRRLAASIGITSSNKGCAAAQWAATKFRLHMAVTASKQLSDEGKCAIEMLSSDIEDVDAKNRASMEAANQKLTNYGYTIDAASCKIYRAYIGQEGSPFQWCSVNPIQKQEIKRPTNVPQN
jgi:hypothetical protein